MGLKPKKLKHKSGKTVYRIRFRERLGANPVSETFDRLKDAQAFCKLIEQVGGADARRIREGIGTKPLKPTQTAFEEYIDQARGYASPASIRENEKIWERHIAPTFAAIPVETITRQMIEKWVAKLRKTETYSSKSRGEKALAAGLPHTPDYLSVKTIKNIHGLLSSILKYQVQMRTIPANPAFAIRLPRAARKRYPTFLTANEFAAIYDATPADWRPLLALLAGTGMRWSEATALKGSDFDLDARIAIVRVERAWKMANGKRVLGAPKTESGVRTISLSRSTIDQIREVVEAAKGDSFVFKGTCGGVLKNEWFSRRVWKPALVKAGIEHIPTLHDLRHSHASWLIAAGVPLTVIQRRLGHSSIKVTSDTYGHLAPDALQVAADAIGIALSQALPEIEG